MEVMNDPTKKTLQPDLSSAFGLGAALRQIGATNSEASGIAGNWTGPAPNTAALMSALEQWRRSRPPTER